FRKTEAHLRAALSIASDLGFSVAPTPSQ
ncbi:hypothetical protein CRG98_048962, partial [Punica granatum]